MLLKPGDFLWVNNSTIYWWRWLLKIHLLHEREWVSDLSGMPFDPNMANCEMHEGIITRGTLPKSVEWHWRIYHPYNCFLLLPQEHRPNPPSREWAIETSFRYYGEDNVREWFYGLPWKVTPFQI